MNIFNIITLFGGLAMFLYGMRMMGDGLKESSSGALKGVMERVTGTPLKPAAVPMAAENREAALRKCYCQALKSLAAFDSRAFHPEYGPVFGHLAAKQREHCCALAELMGF